MTASGEPTKLPEPLNYAPPPTASETSITSADLAPALARLPEYRGRRVVSALLATLLAVGFFLVSTFYWVPAHPGVDQNGYLVGGRMLAENLTMRLAPTKPNSQDFDPHQFVGRMWVGTDFGKPTERYYPKYPIGLPALVAASLWVGGETYGPILAYWINPAAMALAVAATFLLVRNVSNAFWGFCGAIVFATSPVTIGLTTNPNSHATAVCCASWGMCFLLTWWRRRGVWRAVLAGLLLGATATIRYTEGLLILPLLAALFLGIRFRHWRDWRDAAAAIIAWVIPVGILVSYNWVAMGHLTGYDGTNESSGFAWQYASDNWETMLRQLGTIALYCIFPFAVIGLAAMFWRNWRLAIVLGAWVLPCVLVYTFYYWAPDTMAAQVQQGNFIGYMRFFLTILPALVMLAYWLFNHVCDLLVGVAPSLNRIAELGFGAVTLIAIAVQVQTGTYGAELDQNNRVLLQANAQRVLDACPAGSMIFASDQALLHHIQFERDYLLYTGETFNRWFIDRLPMMDPDEPQGWDPGHRDSLYDRLKNRSQAELDEDQRRLMVAAIDSGRRVFFVIPRRDNDPLPSRQRLNNADIREFRKLFPGGEMVRRFATPDRFEVQVVSAWCASPVRPPPVGMALRPRKRRVELAIDRRQTIWEIVEVVRRPPDAPATPAPKPAPVPSVKKQPATAPSTRPAASKASTKAPAATRATSKPAATTAAAASAPTSAPSTRP